MKGYTSVETRNKILAFHNDGYTQRKIANLISISPSTVNYWLNRQGDIDTRPKSGRKKGTTTQEDNQILELCKNNPFLPATMIRKELNLTVSPQTVRNRLTKSGLQNFKTIPKKKLTDRHKNERLDFAIKYENWSIEQWKNVAFTDEKTFRGLGPVASKIWRRRGDDSLKYIPITKSSISVNVWASIGYLNAIHYIDPKSDSDPKIRETKYLTKEYFIKNILDKYIPKNDNSLILLQDNASVHTAYLSKNFLNRHDINTIEIPANSPDLNIIENFWARLDLDCRDRNPTSKQELFQIVKNSFYKLLEEDLIDKLISSMPRRLQAIIQNEGDYTKY